MNAINYYTLPGLFHPTVKIKTPVFTVRNNQAEAMNLIKKIASYYSLPIEKVTGINAFKDIVKARHMSFYFLRLKTGLEYKLIGEIFGRNHSTVISGEKCIRKQLSLKIDNSYKKDVEVLETYL